MSQVSPATPAVAEAEREPVFRWPRLRLLGLPAAPATIDQLHDMLADALARPERIIIASQNLHSLRLGQKDADIRALQEIAYPRIDGMPLIFIGRLFGHALSRDQRVTWVDWMPQLLDEAVRRQWRVFYLGTKPDVVQRGAAVLRERHPGLELAVHHGYFDPTPGGEANEQVLATIDAYQPDLLLVGMGMPQQERWILQNLERLPRPAILTCGAAMDYVAGDAPTPPRWMGRVGLEWLHRLIADPRRLWRRYVLEPWSLLPLLARDLWRHYRERGRRDEARVEVDGEAGR